MRGINGSRSQDSPSEDVMMIDMIGTNDNQQLRDDESQSSRDGDNESTPSTGRTRKNYKLSFTLKPV